MRGRDGRPPRANTIKALIDTFLELRKAQALQKASWERISRASNGWKFSATGLTHAAHRRIE